MLGFVAQVKGRKKRHFNCSARQPLFRAEAVGTAVQTAMHVNSCLDCLKHKELFRCDTVWTLVVTSDLLFSQAMFRTVYFL